MYFKNRAEAGLKLADQLTKYKSQHIVVLALGLGATLVAAQVAMKLHANMLLYVIRDISLPGETEAVAGLGSGDVFTYNQAFSTGQLEEFQSEYRSYIEKERMEQSHELHMLLGEAGEIDKSLLRHRVVLLVADGLGSGFALNVAADYLKTIAIKKLVVATPVASVAAVDRMHLVGDDICCLSTTGNFMGVNHYYDDNTIPSSEDAFKIMRNIAVNWERIPASKPSN
jgi:putative phosphoribosyl transferase